MSYENLLLREGAGYLAPEVTACRVNFERVAPTLCDGLSFERETSGLNSNYKDPTTQLFYRFYLKGAKYGAS